MWLGSNVKHYIFFFSQIWLGIYVFGSAITCWLAWTFLTCDLLKTKVLLVLMELLTTLRPWFFFHRKNLYNRSRPEVLCWRGKGPMVKDNKDFSELNSGTMELWMSLGRELWSCAESLKCCWGMLEAMIWTYGPCTHRKHVLMSSPSI